MVYLEFIDWDRRTPVDIFHFLKAQEGWIDEAEDSQVLNVGRHKGLGAKPAYLCGWRIRDLGRIDEWEAYFKSAAGKTDYAELAALQGLDFVRCGLYDELIYAPLADDCVHFIEYFDGYGSATDDELRTHFERRNATLSGATLACLFRRVGLLGPQDGDIAIWTCPDLASIEPIARARHEGSNFAPLRVGVYRNAGQVLM